MSLVTLDCNCWHLQWRCTIVSTLAVGTLRGGVPRCQQPYAPDFHPQFTPASSGRVVSVGYWYGIGRVSFLSLPRVACEC
jgi:hypothetical protein